MLHIVDAAAVSPDALPPPAPPMCCLQMFDMSGFFFTTANEGSLVGITNVMDACNVVTPW